MFLHAIKRHLFQIGSPVTAGLILCLSACAEDECFDFEFAPSPLTVTIRDAETDELLCDVTIKQDCRSGSFKTSSSPIPCLLAYPDLCEYRLYDWHATDAGTESTTEIPIEVVRYKETVISFDTKQNACGVLEADPQTIKITVEPDPNYED